MQTVPLELIPERADENQLYGTEPSPVWKPGATLRETIGSALAHIGRGWEDVTGIWLNVSELAPDLDEGFWSDHNGRIAQDRVAEFLDIDASAFHRGHWGEPSWDMGNGISFDCQLWLEDCSVRFTERYGRGEYTSCEIIPIKPSEDVAFRDNAKKPKL